VILLDFETASKADLKKVGSWRYAEDPSTEILCAGANINSDLATLFRTVVIAVVLAAILALTKQYQPLASISTRTYAFLALSGIATGASWLCYFRALKLGEASRVAPVDKLSIVLVAVFGAVFLGERLTPANWLGIVLIGCGALLVAQRS